MRELKHNPLKRKRWKNGKRDWFKSDGSAFMYYDIELRRQRVITKDDLTKASEELPKFCQDALKDMAEKHRRPTTYEQSCLMKLCSLSISVWNGGPKDKLPYVHMEEYANEFYIQMVKGLTRGGKSRYDHTRARWPQFVKKWVRLWTIAEIMKRINVGRILDEAIMRTPEELEQEGRTSEEIWNDIKAAVGVTGEVKSEKEIKELHIGK